MILVGRLRQRPTKKRHRSMDVGLRHLVTPVNYMNYLYWVIIYNVELKLSFYIMCKWYFPLNERGHCQKDGCRKDQCDQTKPNEIVKGKQKHVIRIGQLWRSKYKLGSCRRRHRNVLNRRRSIVGHEQGSRPKIRSVLDKFPDHTIPMSSILVLIAPRRNDGIIYRCIHKTDQIVGEDIVWLG